MKGLTLIIFIIFTFTSPLFQSIHTYKLKNSKGCRCYRHDFDKDRIEGRIFASEEVKDSKAFPFVGSIFSQVNQSRSKIDYLKKNSS